MNNDQCDLDIQRLLRTEIRELRHRHEVEIALLHAYYSMKLNGPAADQPAIEDQVLLLAESPLFDDQWYVESYPEAVQGNMSSAEHYLSMGAFEGRDPGPAFETMAYYLANPDVAQAGWPALVHYLQCGQAEGRPLL